MEYRPLGTRDRVYQQYNDTRNNPYDYRNKGLLIKVLPRVITGTTNESLRRVLGSIELLFVNILDYIDILRNFKNWNYRY